MPHAVETRGAVLCAAERKPAFPARTSGRLPRAKLRLSAAGRCCQLGSETAAFSTAKLKWTVFPAHSTREKSCFLVTIPSPFKPAWVQKKEYNRIFPPPQSQIGLSRSRATIKVDEPTQEDLHLRDVGTRGVTWCLSLTPSSHRPVQAPARPSDVSAGATRPSSRPHRVGALLHLSGLKQRGGSGMRMRRGGAERRGRRSNGIEQPRLTPANRRSSRKGT